MTLRAVELVPLLEAPSVAVAARAIVVALILVKLEVEAASKVLVVLLGAKVTPSSGSSRSISSINSNCCSNC